MGTKLNSLSCFAIKILLVALGFAGCTENCGDEYGTPTARYRIRGSVHDEATGQPIENIRTVISHHEDIGAIPPPLRPDGILPPQGTDGEGRFEFDIQTHYTDRLYVLFEDIDGTGNSQYEAKTVEVDLRDAVYTGGSGWYWGMTQKDMGGIGMKETPSE